jgi:hypothetical protein
MKNIFFNEQLTVKGIWFKSYQLYCKTFPQLWPLALITCAIVGLSYVINLFYPFEIGNTITITNVIVIFTSLLLLGLNIFLSSVILHRTYVISEGLGVSWRTSFISVVKKFHQIFVSLLLTYFVSIFGLFLIIAPGIFLYILLVMVQPLIIFDNKGIFTSWKSSSILVWNHWWHTFAVFFPLLLAGTLMGYVIRYVSEYGYMYAYVSNVLVMTIVYPLYYACLFVQFKSLKSS